MELIFVEELPRTRCSKHRLQDLIEEFMNGEGNIAKIDINQYDYKSPTVCYSCMRNAITRSKRGLKVTKRGDTIYLIKM